MVYCIVFGFMLFRVGQYRELFGEPEIVQRVFSVETGVGHDACEQVFKEWKVVNAVVY